MPRNNEDKPLYLPPYSPFLNSIENLFSQWKNHVKRAKPNNQEELMEAISNGASYVTAEDCEGDAFIHSIKLSFLGQKTKRIIECF